MIKLISSISGGGLVHTPAMMEYDGTTGYYSKTSVTTSGNKSTVVLRFSIASFTGTGAQYLLTQGGGASNRYRIAVAAIANDAVGANADCIQVWWVDSAGAIKGVLISPTGYLDGNPHTLFADIDGDAGTMSYRIDGSDADDTGNADRIAPTTGTMESGSAGKLHIAATLSPSGYTAGDIGFFWLDDSAGYNWKDFMDYSGNPKQLDETTWSEWGGTQPLFWNKHGEMDNNKGSAGNMTKTGTIVIGDGGNGPHPVLGINTLGTAIAEDMRTGRAAWINGLEVTGSGVYAPAMMQYDGSTGYYSKTGLTFSGNVFTTVLRFNRASFTGNTFERLLWVNAASGVRCAVTVFSSDHASFANRLGKLQIDIQDSAGSALAKLITPSSVIDGVNHTIFFTFNGTTGAASLILDGSNGDDTGNPDRVAPTTGTLATTTGAVHVGAAATGIELFNGNIGYFGYRDIGGLTWSDFMQSDGSPKAQAESGSWGGWGAQPLFWNEHGYMADNKGSAGNMQPLGLIGVDVDGDTVFSKNYTPAMMKYDGVTGYYNKPNVTVSGNKITMVARFKCVPQAGATSYLIRATGSSTYDRTFIGVGQSDHATVSARNKLVIYVKSSTNTILCGLWSINEVTDDVEYTVFFSFDGDTGAVVFKIDGIDADDTGHTLRTAPTTGTVEQTVQGFGIGSKSGTVPFGLWPGSIGFFGYRDAYLTNWSDFMQVDGTPKAIDESGWTEWGAQPLFWNEHGYMADNKGSAGNMQEIGYMQTVVDDYAIPRTPISPKGGIFLQMINPLGIVDAGGYSPVTGEYGCEVIKDVNLVSSGGSGAWTLAADGYAYNSTGAYQTFARYTEASIPAKSTSVRKYRVWGKTKDATPTDLVGARIAFNVENSASDYWTARITWIAASGYYRLDMLETTTSVTNTRGTANFSTALDWPAFWELIVFDAGDDVVVQANMWEIDSYADAEALSVSYSIGTRPHKAYNHFIIGTHNNGGDECLFKGCEISDI